MVRRICFILSLASLAMAQQGDRQGDCDATSMLQNSKEAQSESMLSSLVDESSTIHTVIASAFTDVDAKAVAAEYIAMTLFIMLGCGSAMGVAKEPGWVLQVALSFGFAISSLAYAIGHYSGGQINCAVTLGLLLTGNLGFYQAIFNFIAQMLGAVSGAVLLTFMCPESKDKSGGIGSNSVNEGYSILNALVGEAAMTFLLMFVILETAVNPASKANRELACLAIGFAVFLAHSVLIPITGCSINPTRSFGPALVYKLSYKDTRKNFLSELWIFWLGPLAGAAGASLVYLSMA